MDDQRKDHIDPKRSPWRNHPKQLQTNNVSIYDLKNTNGTNKGRDLFLGLFPEDQKWCCKRSRGTGELLYIDPHILNENRRKNLAMTRIDYKKASYG